MLAEAADLDATATFMLDMPVALRDALTGVGVPASWMRDKEQVSSMAKKREAEDNKAADLARMQQGADVGKTVADTRQVMSETEA